LGIRLVLQRAAPSQANLGRLTELIAANERDERRELMWGSPGTILAGRELGLDVTPSIEWLRSQRDAEGLWTQQLYGRSARHLGPAHGFAGCALALCDAASIAETLARFAIEEDGLVNWPPVSEMRLDDNGDRTIRTQWCHGAPGIIASLAACLDEELAVAGGELTWRAGPLRKGANLCHGTAGNGYALLAVLERTGDERWLARARAFAMHAARQVERSRSDHGQGRCTLWTGDLGTALYLADCIDGGGEYPSRDGRRLGLQLAQRGLRHRVVEAEALAEAGDALRIHLEPVAAAEVGEAGEIRAALGGVDLGQFAEEVLEPGG
jgi:Lanthionine synthetase C-like protein